MDERKASDSPLSQAMKRRPLPLVAVIVAAYAIPMTIWLGPPTGFTGAGTAVDVAVAIVLITGMLAVAWRMANRFLRSQQSITKDDAR